MTASDSPASTETEPSTPPTSSEPRSFLSDTLIYGIGGVVTMALGFVMLPVYTSALSTAQYGVYELLNSTANIMFVFVYMGVTNSFIRHYFLSETEQWQKEVTITVFVFVFCTFSLVSALFLLFEDVIVTQVIRDNDAFAYSTVFLAWMSQETLFRLATIYLQVNRKPVLYLLANVIRGILYVSLVVYFLLYASGGIYEIFLANTISSGIFGALFLGFCVFKIGWHFNVELLPQLIKYALPYLPATVLLMVVTNGDRYFLNIFTDASVVGVYALAMKLALVASTLFNHAFMTVWGPFLFSHCDEPDGPARIGHVYDHYARATILLNLATAVFAPIVFPLIANQKFSEAETLLPFMCIGTALWGLASTADAGILIRRQTVYKIYAAIVAAIAAAAAHLILTRTYGAWGAIGAYTLGVVALLTANMFFSQRLYRIPISWSVVIGGIPVAAGTYFLYFQLLQWIGPTNVLIELTIGAAAMLAFLGAAYVCRLFGPQHIEEALGSLRRS